jgi:hypothetical protein
VYVLELASTSRVPPPQSALVPNTPSSPPQPTSHRKIHQDRRTAARPGRLYNPELDPIPQPTMHREPDVNSHVSSSAPTPALHRRNPPSHQQHLRPPPPQRQLFDPRNDDPMRFSVLNRAVRQVPPAPPFGGYVSASSTSMSAAQSLGSNFTLNSGTTSSSASSPNSPAGNRSDAGGATAFLTQSKRSTASSSSLRLRSLNRRTSMKMPTWTVSRLSTTLSSTDGPHELPYTKGKQPNLHSAAHGS